MKPFDTLTWHGKARRLRAVALNALAQYDLDLRDVRLLCICTNILYHVRATDGTAYVLRVCTPGWRTGTDLRSEAMWLQALHRETDIGAPATDRGPERRVRGPGGGRRHPRREELPADELAARPAAGRRPERGQPVQNGRALCAAARARGGLERRRRALPSGEWGASTRATKRTSCSLARRGSRRTRAP